MSSSPTALRPFPWRDPLLGFALAMVVLWVLVPALINPGHQGDHLEQFTWAHSMEWGYHKHPPLPTWLLAIEIRLFGPSPYSPYIVAALVTAGTCVFTWLVARELLGERLASLAIVLWGLHWAFTWKAQLLNHNTVMMCCIAAAAWCALRAVRKDGGWRWWVALGVAGGLGLLSKYQSAVPLVGIVIALALAGHLRTRRHVLGLLLAVAITLAIFAPHVVWMVRNDFVTLKYASAAAHQLTPWGRVRKLVTFSALQVRMLLWMLGVIAVLALWARNDPVVEEPSGEGLPERERRAWFIGLLGWPLVVLAVLCIFQGVRLQDHWGFQAVQFVSLWLAARLGRLSWRAAGRLVVLALVAHALAMAAYSRSAWSPRALVKRDRPDQWYPAQSLADAVVQDWRRQTNCPLRYVVGPTYEAGMVSVYSGQNPVVYEMGDPVRSPWVDAADLKRSGAVYVYGATPAEPPGGGAVRKREFRVPVSDKSLWDVYWVVVPPVAPCGGPG
jgi:4-amino-4-deoxy-L-arabinose transferase-like glycosyltransferase